MHSRLTAVYKSLSHKLVIGCYNRFYRFWLMFYAFVSAVSSLRAFSSPVFEGKDYSHRLVPDLRPQPVIIPAS